MREKMETEKKIKAQSTAQVRATISFPPDVYETLEIIAKEKKVSLAWVVRETLWRSTFQINGRSSELRVRMSRD